MRSALWNALRRADLSQACRLLGEEIGRIGGMDEHLILAAFDLEHLRGAPLPLPWRELCEKSHLLALYSTVDCFRRHDWPTVLDTREQAADALTGEASAFLEALAIQAARAIGDLPAARAIANQTLTKHPTNPLILYLALCLELESPFLGCPDLLLVDLATRSQTEDERFYLDPIWLSISRAVHAWINDRDEDREQAQVEIDAFHKTSKGHPLDIAMAVPFLQKLHPTLAASFLGDVPFSAPIFLEVHLRYGLPSADLQTGILQDALALDPSNPFFRLEALLQYLPPRGGEQSIEGLERLIQELPWYQFGLRACVRVGIALREDSWTVRHALSLLQQATSYLEAFDWIVEILEEAQWYDALADIVATATNQTHWWRPEVRSRDERALELLAIGGRKEDIANLLNERVRIAEEGDDNDPFDLLVTRGGRMAMESLSGSALLQPEAILACGTTCTFLGLTPLAKEFLDALKGSRSEGDPLRIEAERIAELCDLVPAVRTNYQDLELLERYLSGLVQIGIEEFKTVLQYHAQRLLQNGRHHQTLRLLRFGLSKLTNSEILQVAVGTLLNEMRDPAMALSFLNEYSEVASQTPEIERMRCVALDKLGRTQDWLRVARESRTRFPSSPDFLIEEGLALATLGDMSAALDLIYQGLKQKPDDKRGAESFRMIAPRFEAHNHLITVLSAALERNPEDIEKRDILIQILGTIEDRSRERLLHLYQRVRRSEPNDEKRKDLRVMLGALRRRLTSRPTDAGSQTERFAEANAHTVRAAIAEVQPLLGNRVIAAVFAEVEVTSSEEKHKEPAVILVLQTAELLELEKNQTKSALLGVLRSRGCKGHIEIFELNEMWDALRRENRFSLDLLLKGIPVGDFPFLNALRMAAGHCRLILEKFDHYVVCYVISGSFVRGTQRIDSDVDVWIVIDDSDIQRMTRQDLHQRLREISAEFRDKIRNELAITRELNVQTYILSSFWRSLQAVDPIIVSLIRDGVPLHDRGLFSAWSRLLRDGYLHCTRESLDSQLNTVENLQKETARRMHRLAQDLAEPIKYGTVKMLEILLQALDLPVGHYRQVIELAAEEVVRLRTLLSTDDLEIARRAIAYVKATETGTLIPLEEALQLYRNVEHFIEKARAIYRQLLAEKDRADLEKIILRLDETLATFESRALEGVDHFRERLTLYRSEARQALDSDNGSDLSPLRISALVERLSEIALSVKLLESQEMGSVADVR